MHLGVRKKMKFWFLYGLSLLAFSVIFGVSEALSNESDAVMATMTTPTMKLVKLTNGTNSSFLRFKNMEVDALNDLAVNIGDTVVLNCDAEGEPPPIIKWEKYGIPLEDICYRMEGARFSSTRILRFTNVLLADSGNYTCIVSNDKMVITRTYILSVRERKETLKPIIREFFPHNLTVTVGSKVRMKCDAEGQFNDTAPYIKFMKDRKMLTGKNNTKLNSSRGEMQDKSMKLERAFSSELMLNHVELDDEAFYTCVAFNGVGYSKEIIYLHVIPAPKPSIYELALAYAAKYGQEESPAQLPLSVTIALPVALVVILTIGFVWWKENVRRKLEEQKITLINMKKMRDMDNFSSLEHMEKFSSRMETKPSSSISEDIISGTAIDHHDDLDDDDYIDDHEHDHLIRNGHPLIHSHDSHSKTSSPRATEMIPLRDMETVLSDTPVTGRSSGMGSQPELEWEPVDLKLNVSKNNELPQILDTSA